MANYSSYYFVLCLYWWIVSRLNADGCSRDFYRDVMSMVGGGAAGAALLVLLTLLPMKVGRLRNSRGR